MGRRALGAEGPTTMLEDLVPTPRKLEVNAVDLAAPPTVIWNHIRHADLADSPLVRALFALRTLPSRLGGRTAELPGIHIDDLRSTAERPGFQLLGEEPPRELTVGAIGKVWQLDIPFAARRAARGISNAFGTSDRARRTFRRRSPRRSRRGAPHRPPLEGSPPRAPWPGWTARPPDARRTASCRGRRRARRCRWRGTASRLPRSALRDTEMVLFAAAVIGERIGVRDVVHPIDVLHDTRIPDVSARPAESGVGQQCEIQRVCRGIKG